MIPGTKADTVIAIIKKIHHKQRKLVMKITLNVAGNMSLITKKCLPIFKRKQSEPELAEHL
ncbi:hypothetical protein [Flavobacterium limicola]|uniref:hypothetical protein n=1 Tax=Flavobacterium limicola TaxID=180441 RepID=UPI000EADEF38|nr:hypothetical protein [Flavobacterium limicola]